MHRSGIDGRKKSTSKKTRTPRRRRKSSSIKRRRSRYSSRRIDGITIEEIDDDNNIKVSDVLPNKSREDINEIDAKKVAMTIASAGKNFDLELKNDVMNTKYGEVPVLVIRIS